METLRQIIYIPRAIVRDFKVVFVGIGNYARSFARGYVAFFWELVDDAHRLLTPYLKKNLYDSILKDFYTVLMGAVTPLITIYRLIISVSSILLQFLRTLYTTLLLVGKDIVGSTVQLAHAFANTLVACNKVFIPFFRKELYIAVLQDFKAVLLSIVTLSATLLHTFSSPAKILHSNLFTAKSTAQLPTRNILRKHKTSARVEVQGQTATEPDTRQPTFFKNIYQTLLEADQPDVIPIYIIVSSIVGFILGCVWFYLFMVFGV